jgi:membrane fusion protein, multidrug efflux system
MFAAADTPRRESSGMRSAVGWSAALLAVSALVAGGCSAQGDAAPSSGRGRSGNSDAAIPVTTAPVVRKSVPLDFQAIGTVQPYSTVAIHAQITGQLTSVSFREGDDVRQGQVLFTLDKRPLEAALQQSQANLQRDQAQLVNAQAQVARYADLDRRGIATREQVDQMNATAAALQATVGADRAAVDNAQVQLQYATITAPISGRTGALMVQAGNLVRGNDTTPLVVIDEVQPIYVAFSIPESELPTFKTYMAKGAVKLLALPPNAAPPAAQGRITFVDNSVDATTGTIKLKGEFENHDERLWPGQFVDVTVTLTEDPNAIVVPTAAVQTGPQGTYVYVAKPDQTVDLRPVAVTRTHGDDSVIDHGVTPGEIVVTDGQIRLVPGSRITVKSTAPAQAPS